MAQNQIPKNRGQISGFGDKMKAGLTALGVSLGITQITAATFGALLSAFKAAFGTYNSKRSSEQAAYNLFHSKEEDIVAWLTVVRGIFIGHFGNRWNTMWAQVGFVQPSTAIPRRVQDRISLVQKVGAFLTADPSYEVPDRDVTAAKATELYDAIQAAQAPLQTAQAARKTAEDALDSAQAALVKAMRMLIDILAGLLGKDDPRWEAFGLNRPGMNTTPAAPTGLNATVMGSAVLLGCDHTALATRYRFRRKITGVDTSFRLVASSRTPMAVLEGVEAGLTMEFIVQAVNGASQSVPSDPIIVTTSVESVPQLEAAAHPSTAMAEETNAPDTEVVPLAALVPNGNGSANSNGSSLATSRVG